MNSAIVFDIRRFSVHDGPGIRTTVFLKGCPLRCVWCHNPESWRSSPEILFSPEKCSRCGTCVMVCPERCRTPIPGEAPGFDRSRCTACGRCADRCLSGALELCGVRRLPEEVLREVLKDRIFYENSGGGLTLSGGEPMFSLDFTRELLELARRNGIHVCMETCGFAPPEQFREILPMVDLFLFDIKSVLPEKHRRFTGRENGRILENLRLLNRAGAELILRCPIVPGWNDSEPELLGLAALAEELGQVRAVEVEAYHPLGVSKAHRLGLEGFRETAFAPPELVMRRVAAIASATRVPVRKI